MAKRGSKKSSDTAAKKSAETSTRAQEKEGSGSPAPATAPVPAAAPAPAPASASAAAPPPADGAPPAPIATAQIDFGEKRAVTSGGSHAGPPPMTGGTADVVPPPVQSAAASSGAAPASAEITGHASREAQINRGGELWLGTAWNPISGAIPTTCGYRLSDSVPAWRPQQTQTMEVNAPPRAEGLADAAAAKFLPPASTAASLSGVVGANAVAPAKTLAIGPGGAPSTSALPSKSPPTAMAETPASALTGATAEAPSAGSAISGTGVESTAGHATAQIPATTPAPPQTPAAPQQSAHVRQTLAAPVREPLAPVQPDVLPEDVIHSQPMAAQDRAAAAGGDATTAAQAAAAPPLLFEIAWEVCWQLGGIYTVLRSKAATMLEYWHERYFMVGPYNPQTAAVEFEPREPQGFMRQVIDRMTANGIPCHFGRWLIAGRPPVVLIDYRAMFRSLDGDKYLLWKDHGIGTNPNDGEVNEVVAFGFAVTEFFRHLTSVVTDRPVLAHFHEWMGGVAVPRIAHLQIPVSTIFTTHATLLGRYLANDNPYFYQHLGYVDPDAEAAKFNILPRHLIEKAAAHASTVFTTVSEVTATEAALLLRREPDAILPNGLNIHRFAALHEFQNLHRQYKERIHEFVMGHFFPCYTFDLDKTIYLFTSGRYEYRNKGMDMFIEAMYRLNLRLRALPEKERPTVVAFIVTRAATKNINVSVLQNQVMFQELHATCVSLQEEMGRQLFWLAAQGKLPSASELLSEDAQVRLKRAMHAWRTGQPPVIVTHDLVDDANDAILKHLRHRGMFNAGDDPVKVIFHPQFMSVNSPLVGLDYEQFVRGCHMGIFPSYYEPWGYTPMESVALGLPALTTDLSGFGAYVQKHIRDARGQGICVLRRHNKSFEETTNDMVDYLLEFVTMSRRERIALRNKVERLSELFDWSKLISHYHDAHQLALKRLAQRTGKIQFHLV